VGFSGRLSPTRFTGAAFEGPASAWTEEALAETTPLASSIFSPEPSAEAGVGILVDSKTTSKTLVVVAVAGSFNNSIIVGRLSSFGYTSAVFFGPGSFTGSTLALTGIAGTVSVAKGTASAFSINFTFSVTGTSAVFSMKCSFGLWVRTLALFVFYAPKEVEVAIFHLNPCFQAGKQ
jgi:hypothetical protein